MCTRNSVVHDCKHEEVAVTACKDVEAGRPCATGTIDGTQTTSPTACDPCYASIMEKMINDI